MRSCRLAQRLRWPGGWSGLCEAMTDLQDRRSPHSALRKTSSDDAMPSEVSATAASPAGMSLPATVTGASDRSSRARSRHGSGKGLSAVIVAFNEDAFLGECLDRLAFCDDRVVIDLGSRDRSAEVATAHGARVLPHSWVPFAEKVRGFGIEQARFDWIILSDPDIYFSAEAGDKVREVIRRYEGDGLGMVYLPLETWFGDSPLKYGQKGGLRGYRAVIHRARVRQDGLLHHRGVALIDPYFALGVCGLDRAPLIHHWVGSIGEAVVKAKRYHSYEAESRHATGQVFRWEAMFEELLNSLRLDLREKAWLDGRSMRVMLFQLWYIWKANMAMRASERNERILVGSSSRSG